MKEQDIKHQVLNLGTFREVTKNLPDSALINIENVTSITLLDTGEIDDIVQDFYADADGLMLGTLIDEDGKSHHTITIASCSTFELTEREFSLAYKHNLFED